MYSKPAPVFNFSSYQNEMRAVVRLSVTITTVFIHVPFKFSPEAPCLLTLPYIVIHSVSVCIAKITLIFATTACPTEQIFLQEFRHLS